ncbi:ExbD/TolR family protein [Steroidobacter cummioxidans]|uniref:ExbD/TolR family protein n=1 Tax=Steroidobacter cummioxidans TaxID=1803913 RepID=UPI000E323E36|nr:biopolymer transporter ExbD [Steroidobacter cummioxidans]
MAMNVGGGGEGEPMLDINTTPLIDVMLVLLIMFIITLPVLTHAVKLDMPSARTPPPDQIQTQPIRVDIDWDGTVLWDGNVVTLDELEGYFRAEAARRPQPELHVRPDRRAAYDTVAKVLAIAQRNGMQRIGFVGNEQFMNE